MPATSGLSVDPYDAQTQQCPMPAYHALREACPVYHSRAADLYLITRYDLIDEVLRDPETFSNRMAREEPPSSQVAERLAAVRAHGWEHVPTLATEDPPAHTQFRSVVMPFFSPARMRAYEARAREICADLVGGLADTDVDFVTAFAEPLPIQVTAEVMGLDVDLLPQFKRWTKDATAAVGHHVDDERRLAAECGIVEMQQHLHARIEQARRAPGDDFFSALVEGRVAGADGEPRPLTLEEMLSLARQVFVGGIETTTKLLAEGVRLLAEQPAEYARLRADPAMIPRAVEEMLRLSSPAQGIFRVATRDTVLGGCPLPAGARLVVMYAAANRDPAVFPGPDRYDPQRSNVRRHLAFGKGTHFCPGAPVTRIESVVALEALTARFPRLDLVAGANDFSYEPSFVLRGLTSLWVRFATDGAEDPTDRRKP